MGSKEEQEAAWLWSQRTWAQVPAPVTLHQAQRCTRLGAGAGDTVRYPSGLAQGREEQASQGPQAFPDGRVLVWLGLGV